MLLGFHFYLHWGRAVEALPFYLAMYRNLIPKSPRFRLNLQWKFHPDYGSYR